MARSDTEEEINKLKLQQIRGQIDDQRYDKMRSTGTNASGQPIIGWSDSRTPIVGASNSGQLSTGSSLTPQNQWANQFRRRDDQIPTVQATIPSTIPQQVLDAVLPKELPAFNTTASISLRQPQSQPLSLQDIASNPTHIQMWSQPKTTQKVGNYGTETTLANGNKTLTSPYGSGFTTYGTPKQKDESRYSWASGF